MSVGVGLTEAVWSAGVALVGGLGLWGDEGIVSSEAQRAANGPRSKAAAMALAAGMIATAWPGVGAHAAATASLMMPAAFEPAAGPAVADGGIKARLDQGNALTIAGERLHVALL